MAITWTTAPIPSVQLRQITSLKFIWVSGTHKWYVRRPYIEGIKNSTPSKIYSIVSDKECLYQQVSRPILKICRSSKVEVWSHIVVPTFHMSLGTCEVCPMSDVFQIKCPRAHKLMICGTFSCKTGGDATLGDSLHLAANVMNLDQFFDDHFYSTTKNDVFHKHRHCADNMMIWWLMRKNLWFDAGPYIQRYSSTWFGGLKFQQ